MRVALLARRHQPFPGGTPIDGVDGLLNRMTKAVIERALQAEMTHELGYARDDPAGAGSGNSRNGSARKTIATANGPVTIDVPRDRNGTFEPKIVPKRARRLGQIDEMVLSLYARGLSTRDIEAHLLEVYGVKASRELISNVTEAVIDEIETWRNRPLEELYPILYMDALVIKVRDRARSPSRPPTSPSGSTWTASSTCWASGCRSRARSSGHGVCAELRNRGHPRRPHRLLRRAHRLPRGDRGHRWPDSIVQTCTVHLIRAAMRFVSYQDRKKVAAALRPIYTAPTIDAAESELLAFADSPLGRRYPATVATWENAWQRFTPFLAFPPELRRIIYTTDEIVNPLLDRAGFGVVGAVFPPFAAAA